ncbi:NHL repeat-containing protein [Gorgonomyces haynaldii]|nr:NHL repeat-containing protein [Gorgonomyces haynaldii]
MSQSASNLKANLDGTRRDLAMLWLITSALAAVGDLSYLVSTYAGSGIASNTNGPLLGASIYTPYSIARDSQGNFFISSKEAHCIRKISNTGTVSTLAGLCGMSGNAVGTGTAARFSYPYGIAVDASDDLYVADTNNDQIRKITQQGVVTAYTGGQGFVDGSLADARFDAPFYLVFDSKGNLFVADSGNNRIRKITPDGQVSTFAGTGYYSASEGNGLTSYVGNPVGIAIDADDTLYVSLYGLACIQKITSSAVVSILAGKCGTTGSADGQPNAARFQYPFGLDVDANGFVYVTETQVNRIRKITPAGVVSTFSNSGNGGYRDGPIASALFQGNSDILIERNGIMWVADPFNHRIRKITAYEECVIGGPTTTAGASCVASKITVTYSTTVSSLTLDTDCWRFSMHHNYF